MRPQVANYLKAIQSNDTISLPFLAPRAFAPWPVHLRKSRRYQHQEAHSGPLHVHEDGKSIGPGRVRRSPAHRGAAKSDLQKQNARGTDPSTSLPQSGLQLIEETHLSKGTGRTRRRPTPPTPAQPILVPSREKQAAALQRDKRDDDHWHETLLQGDTERGDKGSQISDGSDMDPAPCELFEPEDSSLSRSATLRYMQNKASREPSSTLRQDLQHLQQSDLFEPVRNRLAVPAALRTLIWSENRGNWLQSYMRELYLRVTEIEQNSRNQPERAPEDVKWLILQPSSTDEKGMSSGLPPISTGWSEAIATLIGGSLAPTGPLRGKRSDVPRPQTMDTVDQCAFHAEAALFLHRFWSREHPQIRNNLAEVWLRDLCGPDTWQHLPESWANLPDQVKAHRWPFLMLYYLQNKPWRALWFLSCTQQSWTPPSYQIADVFQVLTLKLFKAGTPFHSEIYWSKRIRFALEDVLARYRSPLPLEESTIRSLCLHDKPSGVLKTYKLLTSKQVNMSSGTRLDYVFPMLGGRPNDHRRRVVLQVLLHVWKEEQVERQEQEEEDQDEQRKEGQEQDMRHSNSAQVKKRGLEAWDDFFKGLTLLLRACRTANDSGLTLNECLTSVTAAGIPLRTHFLNEVLCELRDHGSHAQIWSVFEQFGSLGVKLDAHTLTILLNWLRSREGSIPYNELAEKIDRIVHEARIRPTLFKSTRLGIACLTSMTLTKGAGFQELLDFYERYWTLDSLKSLGAINASYTPKTLSSDAEALHEPNVHMVTYMLQSFSKGPASVDDMLEVYNNLSRLRDARNPAILKLASQCEIWTVILGKLNDAVDSPAFEMWPEILRNMTSQIAVGASSSEEQTLSTYVPPQPSVLTWNTIVHGLARRKQYDAVEDVMKLMKKHGHAPETHTWHSILHSYAESQDLQGIKRTIRRMELAGISFDEVTRKILDVYEDQKELLQELRLATERGKGTGPEYMTEELFEPSDGETSIRDVLDANRSMLTRTEGEPKADSSAEYSA